MDVAGQGFLVGNVNDRVLAEDEIEAVLFEGQGTRFNGDECEAVFQALGGRELFAALDQARFDIDARDVGRLVRADKMQVDSAGATADVETVFAFEIKAGKNQIDLLRTARRHVAFAPYGG